MRLLHTVNAIFIATTAALGQTPASAPSPDDHTLLLMHFDGSADADLAKGSPKFQVTGATFVAEGKWGGAISLQDAQSLSIPSEANLNMTAGTLSLWVKPSWTAPTERSHTLLSMGLDGDPAGYFALSQGWWESGGGGGRMYFIYDNQSYMHASSDVFMAQGAHLNHWHHIVLTWAEGSPGHNALYVDGRPAAKTVRDCPGVRRPRTPLVIGSDSASGLANGRWANALVDELVVYDRAMGEAEVLALFKSQEPQWEQILAREWAWLTDVLSGPQPTFARDGQGRVLESRAILDEGSGWIGKEQTDERVEKMRRAGFNVYIPCVWHGRGTWWPSTLEPPQKELTEKLNAESDDPLAHLIARCHEAGIEVHPWFCVSKRERDLHPEFTEETTPKGFFDVRRPEFRDFIVDLMLDVIRRYEVDGINLDYIRSGGVCTGPKCREEYRARFGTELLEDLKLKEANGFPCSRVVQWQDDAIADIVRRVAEEGRRIRPGLILSVDGHIQPPTTGPSTDGRNEKPWIEAGWVDVVYNMDYGRTLSFARIDAVRASVGKPHAVVDLPGNYETDDAGKVMPRDGKLVADQIAFCQRKWPGNGVGLYLYSMLDDGQIERLRAGPFREDAIPHWVRQ